MPSARPLPEALAHRPFTRDEAVSSGFPSDLVRPPRFVRLHPRVWVSASHTLTTSDRVRAAMLSVGDDVVVSHESRLALLGVESGPPGPVRFLVESDLHLSLEGIVVHRTTLMPPRDDVGVEPYAAYVCAGHTRRLLDLVVLGDWLLRRGHLTCEQVVEMATEEGWRPGAARALWAVPQLNPRARSPKESELRAILVAAGLPVPEVNVDLVIDGRWIACVDLLFAEWGLVVEYEGRQHAEDKEQFATDIARYGRMREARVPYEQVTQAMLDHPRALVLHVHRALVKQGYRGPSPRFGAQWRALFAVPRAACVPDSSPM